MSDYFIKCILLKNCPYSIAAFNLIKSHNIPNDIYWIDSENKNLYRTEYIKTFPQIYLQKKNKNGNLLLGGYDDLNNFINIFMNKQLSNDDLNKFMNKYQWSKKSTLRFIQLINQK